MLKCLKKNCKLTAHAYCIQLDRKTQIEGSVDDEGAGWEVEFRLQDYTVQPCF